MSNRSKKPHNEKDFEDELIEALSSQLKKLSSPSPPYYYKEEGSDAYHWHMECHKNHYPNSGWVKKKTKPSSREQCDSCQKIIT